MIKREFKRFCVIISGPTGSGKTTICKKLLEGNNDFFYSISCTTRKKRENEINGEDYYFVSKEEFEKMIKEDKFLEYAKIYNEYYGTPKEPVFENLKNGKIVIMDIDFQGKRKIQEKMKDIVSIYLLPPSIEELKKRIEKREKDKENFLKRFKEALREIDLWIDYDYVVINDEIERAIYEIKTIIEAEKLKRERLIIEKEER
ncbi:MAG: guanylate kinase [candidate division WOR-3 bacterium]